MKTNEKYTFSHILALGLALLAAPAFCAFENNQAAELIIGQSGLSEFEANNYLSGHTRPVGFNYPMGVAVSTTLNKTFVADTSNHRVLIYDSIAPAHGQAANVVLGHPNFTNNVPNDIGDGANVTGPVAANNFKSPTGVYTDGTRLAVVDAGNHRVLIWNNAADLTNFKGADLVLGQKSFSSDAANTGGVSAETFWYPYSVSGYEGRLIVADQSNNRVLIWDEFPTKNGQAATQVLGQPDFSANSANNSGLSASTLDRPYGATMDGSKVYVADSYNYRVLIWNWNDIQANPPGAPASVVVGQPDMACNKSFATNACETGSMATNNLKFPTSVAADGGKLFVTDTNISRVLIWNTIPEASFSDADVVLGGLYYPWGLTAAGGALFVADRYNHRIVRWGTIPTVSGTPPQGAMGHVGASSEFATIGVPNAGPFADGLHYQQRVMARDGRLFAADTGNNRVLIWNSIPSAEGAPADIVLGQPDMRSKGIITPPNSSSLYAPRGVFYDGRRLFVADTANQRILVWNSLPQENNKAAGIVLGQPHFLSNTANTGGVSAKSLWNPTSIFSDGRRLYAADQANHRVLVWNDVGNLSDGKEADLVLGHSAFNKNVKNDDGSGADRGPWAGGLHNPSSVHSDGIRLFVADATNNRVLVWNTPPTQNGQAADEVLGQANFLSTSPNRGGDASEYSLKNPMDIHSDGRELFVADWGNHRILTWENPRTGSAAGRVLGQPDFSSADPTTTGASALNPVGVWSDGGSLYGSIQGQHAVKVWRSTVPVSRQLFVKVSTLTVSPLIQGTTPQAFLRIDAHAGELSATLDGLKAFNDTAAADDSLRLHWYIDNENYGGESSDATFDPAQDISIESTDFISSTAAFTSGLTVGGTTVTFWLALTLKDLPYPHVDLPEVGIRVTQNYISFPMKIGELGSLGLPVYSNTAQALDQEDVLSLAGVSSPLLEGAVAAAGSRQVMASLTLKTLSDFAYLRQLKVGRTGDSAQSHQLRLYKDGNGDKLFSDSDPPLSESSSFAGVNFTLLLDNLEEIGTDGVTLFVVATMNEEASEGKTFGISLDQSSFIFDLQSPDSMSEDNLPYQSPQVALLSSQVEVAAVKGTTGAWTNDPEFIFSANFGENGVASIDTVWDKFPEHVWPAGQPADQEDAWSVGNSTKYAASDGDWYLHARSYNAAEAPGGVRDLGPFRFDGTPPTGSGFSTLNSAGDVLPETGWNDSESNVPVGLALADPASGLASSGFGVSYSNDAGGTWTAATATLNGGALSAIVDPVPSATQQICGGPFCDAVNQVKFTAMDIAGNILEAGPFAILVDTSPTVLVHLDDKAPASVLQGRKEVMLSINLRTISGTANWTGLKVKKAGEASVAQVLIYRDNHDGYFDGNDGSPEDVQISQSGDGEALVTFSSPETLTKSTAAYFLVFKIADGAVPDGAIKAIIENREAFVFEGEYTADKNQTYPFESSEASVSDGTNELLIEGESLAPATVRPGERDAAFLRLKAATLEGTSKINSIALSLRGTGSSADLGAIRLYRSADASFDAQADTVASNGASFANGVYTVSLDPQSLGRTPVYFFAVIDISEGAHLEKKVGLSIASTGAVVLANTSDTASFKQNDLSTGSIVSAEALIQRPNTLNLQLASLMPEALVQGAEYAVLKASLTLDIGQVQVSELKFYRLGNGSAGDIAAVNVYMANDLDGDLDPSASGFFEALIELGSGVFNDRSADIAITPPALTAGATQVYFVSYRVSPSGAPGHTAGIRLSSNLSVTISNPVGTVAGSSFPFNSGLGTIAPTRTGLMVSGQDMGLASVKQGDLKRHFLTLTMKTPEHSVPWTAIALEKLGSAPAGSVAGLGIYLDDDDGVLDDGDTEVFRAADPFEAGPAFVLFDSPQNISTDQRRYFVTLDLAPFAAHGKTVGIMVASTESVKVAEPNDVLDANPTPSDSLAKSSLAEIEKIPDTLTLSPENLLTDNVIQGTEFTALKVLARAAREEVSFEKWKVALLGNIGQSLVQVRIYKDFNGDRAWDTADRLIGEAAFSGDHAEVSFERETVGVSTETYFLRLKIGIDAAVDATIGLHLEDLSLLGNLSPDFVAGDIPFQAGPVQVLDAKTPTQPEVRLARGAYSDAFESIRFTWDSSVITGSISSAAYAIGTTPGGQQVRPYTAISAAEREVTASGLVLSNGTTYFVSVEAVSNHGYTSETGISDGQLIDTATPERPLNLSAIIGEKTVILSWGESQGGASGVKGYLVRYRSAQSPVWKNAVDHQTLSIAASPSAAEENLVSSVTIAVTGIPSGTLYFQVYSVSGAGVLSPPAAPLKVQFGTLGEEDLSNLSVYPNPFDSRKTKATIVYNLTAAIAVRVRIFDVFGGRIKDMSFSAGAHGAEVGTNEIKWDGADDAGMKVSKGMYLALIEAGSARETKKIGVAH